MIAGHTSTKVPDVVYMTKWRRRKMNAFTMSFYVTSVILFSRSLSEHLWMNIVWVSILGGGYLWIN